MTRTPPEPAPLSPSFRTTTAEGLLTLVVKYGRVSCFVYLR
ncbi:hypothetical protein AVEN_58639-1, partial [Araneus ventricosus]